MTEYDLPPKQRSVLEFIRSRWGGEFANNISALREISSHIGWKHHHSARDALYALRSKGFLASQGRRQAQPEKWMLP